jgi:RNA polymerase sigma-70 factor (ECF subfamily)
MLLVVGLAAGRSPEDKALAARIQKGDREAFRRFYERHHARLYRYLRRRGVRTDVAEDLVQKAFIYVWEHRERIDPGQSLRGYLFRIGYTRMLNHQRDTDARETEASLGDRAALDDRPSPAPSPQDQAAYEDLQGALQAAVERLPERRREVFELCFAEDLTYREAADVLDISPKTVETQMRRAFQALQDALEAYRADESKA